MNSSASQTSRRPTLACASGQPSLRAPAQYATSPGDSLWRHDFDRVAVESQPRDQPGIVVGRLIEGASGHNLARDEAAGLPMRISG